MPSPADQLEQGDVPEHVPGQPMHEDALRSLLRTHLRSAVNYRDTELAPKRRKMQAYFEGEKTLDGDLPYGNNRSSYVSRDVKDLVTAMLPQVIDVFFGSDEGIVEFVPTRAETVESSRKATLYVQYLCRSKGGMELFLPVFLDSFKNMVGVVRYHWRKRKDVREEELEGLTQAEFDELTAPREDSTVDVLSETRSTVEVDTIGVDGLPMLVREERIDCKVRVTIEKGELDLYEIPPEERLIDENARSFDKSMFWAHARNVPIGDLIDLGYTYDELEDCIGGDEWLTDEEAEQRENSGDRSDLDKGDPMMRSVPYADCFLRGDIDGAGVGLFRICVGGAQTKILMEPERVGEIEASEFTSEPVEHVATGNAYADRAIGEQALRTSLFRGMLDSLSQALFPRTAFHETAVNANDLLNNEPGALVRCKGSPAQLVQELVTSFTGSQVLSVLQYTDTVKENRTGVSRTTAGLDPNALQSTTKSAADHVVSGSQKQVYAVAKILAEFCGMKRLFKGILRTLVKNKAPATQFQMQNGDWVDVNPVEWDLDMDCRVKIGKGAASVPEKIEVLDRIMGAQKELLMVKSPLVDEQKIYNTLDKYVQLTDYRDTTMFFNRPVPPQEGQPPPSQGDAPQSPESALAQAEVMKAQVERQSAAEKNLNERIKILLEDDRARDEMEMEFELKLATELIKAGANINVEQFRQQVNAKIARERQYGELAARAQAAASQQGAPTQ